MKKSFLIFFLLLLIVTSILPPPVVEALASEPTIQVKLKNYIGNRTHLTVTVQGDFQIESSQVKLTNGKTYIIKVESGQLHLYEGANKLLNTNRLHLIPMTYTSYLTINNKPYLGAFHFEVENSLYIRPTNTVYLEDYLKGVVPFEMMASWPIEALKAQAIAARTYAASYLNKTIDDTISYQVYGGYDWHPNSSKAVNETYGEVLKKNNYLISTVFSASNGGKTESNANAWGSIALSYLPMKEDPFDARTNWNFTLHKKQIQLEGLDLKNPSLWWNTTKEKDEQLATSIKLWLQQNGHQGKDLKIMSIPKLSLHSPTSGGRVSKGDITIEYFIKDHVDSSGKLVLQKLELHNSSAAKLRAMIGNRVMLSYYVTNVRETTDTLSVSGLGDGHGVGLSQWGAKNRADAGHTYKEILGFYYEGATLHIDYKERVNHVPSVENPTVHKPAPVAIIPKPQTSEPKKIVDKTPPVISQVKTTVDQKKKNLTLSFKVNEASKVTLYLKDSKGNIFHYVMKGNPVHAGTVVKAYDITKLANGTYKAGIISVDPNENQASTSTSFVVKHSPTTTLTKAKTGKVTASKLHVRSSGSTKAKVIGSLKKNQTVTILSTSGSWHKIKYGKSYGYVAKIYVK
ncbi:SpoIID/LytB domain-containing protein [Metabacillus sp. HB246100]